MLDLVVDEIQAGVNSPVVIVEGMFVLTLQLRIGEEALLVRAHWVLIVGDEVHQELHVSGEHVAPRSLTSQGDGVVRPRPFWHPGTVPGTWELIR